VYGVIFEPATVDSTRPTHLKEQPVRGGHDTADARLWDDPFVVFPDASADKFQPFPVGAGERTLILVIPTKTSRYQEDRESRLRLRFAVQRALLDQGYAPVQGSLLQLLHLPKNESRSGAEGGVVDAAFSQRPSYNAPMQMFSLTKIAEARFQKPGMSRYRLIVVVWLPDEVLRDVAWLRRASLVG
jgi:hypothetical protein